MAWENESEPVKWYAGGAFDGDGCVHITKRQLAPRLVITQATRGKALLEEFQRLFGGSIYTSKAPVDPTKHQQTLAWCLTGVAAAHACLQLAPYTHLKRQQLVLASQFAHKMPKETKQYVADDIATLKKQPHEPIQNIPIPEPYAAGIIDTDGSLRAYPSISLSVTQKYPAVVTALHTTFQRGSISRSPQAARWHVYGSTAKDILRSLEPYLVAKKDQAHIVLEAKLTKDTDARIALMALQGNQGPRNKLSPHLSKLQCLKTCLRRCV